MKLLSKVFFIYLLTFLASAPLAPGQAQAQDQVDLTYDCTSGCYIVTCAEANCTLWRCDANGCRVATSFQQEKRLILKDRKDSPADNAYAKICPAELSCSLYELSAERATYLGKFDDIDGIISDLQSKRIESLRQN